LSPTSAGSSRTTGCSAPPPPAGSRPRTRARASPAIRTPGSSAIRPSSTGCGPTTRSSAPRRSAPLVGVTTYHSLAEAIELANAPGYGLSASIYTRQPDEVFAFRRGVGAGMVSVNNSTSGAEAHLPFGGNGKSGNGSRQSGIWVLDQFTRWQSMNWDYSGRLQKAQMDVAELTGDESFRLAD
jgi:aldehyde dehydrogenase (NAD+)